MKWLADENFRNAIIRGLLRQAPTFDVVRARMFLKSPARVIWFCCGSRLQRAAWL